MPHRLETLRGRVMSLVAGPVLLGGLVIATCVIAGPAPRAAERTTAAATRSAALTKQVRIKDFAFEPATLEVPVGSTVTWTNADEDTHTVTSSSGAFSSPGLDGGETFSRTFAATGAYSYFCALHPHMTARIIVK